MIKINPTTPVNFYAKNSVYVNGQGHTSAWEKIEIEISETQAISTFYGEWRGSYGDRVTSAQALGVNDSATFRMFYNPEIYNKLRTTQVLIVKNADQTAFENNEIDSNNPNVYELWSGVDNIQEENKYMEFRIKRYEGK